MSDHIAYALLAYTGLQIFVTMGALNAKSGSLLPYFALVVLVAVVALVDLDHDEIAAPDGPVRMDVDDFRRVVTGLHRLAHHVQLQLDEDPSPPRCPSTTTQIRCPT